jgi:hypothetical protein
MAESNHKHIISNGFSCFRQYVMCMIIMPSATWIISLSNCLHCHRFALLIKRNSHLGYRMAFATTQNARGMSSHSKEFHVSTVTLLIISRDLLTFGVYCRNSDVLCNERSLPIYFLIRFPHIRKQWTLFSLRKWNRWWIKLQCRWFFWDCLGLPLIMIPPLLHTHVSPPSRGVLYRWSNSTLLYPGFQVTGFICDLALRWFR